MRFRHPDGTGIHLAYCTNVHPAEDLDGVLAQLTRFAEPVRERLGADRLGVGLWLARDVASALATGQAQLRRLRAELAARGLEVVTLNGFPYQGFHAPVVKHAVYSPDWSQRARLDYTVDLARVLAELLPDDAARGSISTLPLAWRRPWPARRHAAALRQLAAVDKVLAALPRPVRLALEPEPGCVVETTAELRQVLDELAELGADRIGSCLDLCHLAVGFEHPQAAVAAADPVVKAQVSCALQADDPAQAGTRRALESFAEPRFLHQTRAAHGRRWDDLDQALDALDADDALEALGGDEPGPWRVHFHIPLHAAPDPPLTGTSAALRDMLAALLGGPAARVDHLEVETYTWHVLPPEQRPPGELGLVESIAAELDWTRGQLLALGLEEERVA